ncbi:hypothetical protein LTR36_001435 [Oleoguttula mirabilis]|uniref:C2H2-type domain-containing protein n=1 Tax=Oleoguttula mirabilis TaxID=1507867 RepID=A0AAV9JNT9_9PEZI|nr:hypothetical protein LTR36_001435 [Oleoguttula mirabilis]
MAAIATPCLKRKVTHVLITGSTPSPLPIAKRVRYEASIKMDEEKAWESIVRDMDRSSPMEDYTPTSPGSSDSTASDAQSVAETSFTSASTAKRPKKYLCEYAHCGKAFDRPVRLQIHVRSHTNERPYACAEAGCDKTFLRAEHLNRHVKDKHNEVKSYICTYDVNTAEDGAVVECGKSFTTATRLRRHTAAHEAKEETRCLEPGCGKVFRKQETLQRHIKQDHLHEKAFQCTHVEMDSEGQPHQCQHAFARAVQLKGHEEREHSGLRYFCDLCSPSQPQQPDDDDDDMEELEALAVTSERVGFQTYTDLQAHIRTAHPPTCADCGKQCESNRALKAHIDIEHSALSERQQKFKCTWPGCDRGFTKAGNLKVHMQNVHTKARNFACGTFDLVGNPKVEGWNGRGCGSAFGTKANLEEHVRTQHLGLPSQIRPCRQNKIAKKKMKKRRGGGEGSSGGAASTPSTLMDIDELATPDDDLDPANNNALSKLTGFGYADTRRTPCLIAGCPMRFSREYDLAAHLELTHGWHVDDVNDRLAEKEALEGGKFWIGGREPMSLAAEEALRQQLMGVLGAPSPPVGVVDDDDDEAMAGYLESEEYASEGVSMGWGTGMGAATGDEEYQQRISELQKARAEGYEQLKSHGVTVNGMLGANGEAMVLDPALAGF